MIIILSCISDYNSSSSGQTRKNMGQQAAARQNYIHTRSYLDYGFNYFPLFPGLIIIGEYYRTPNTQHVNT